MKYTLEQIQSAIESFLNFGESSFVPVDEEKGKGHYGYFSGSGWGATVLRAHLSELKGHEPEPKTRPWSKPEDVPSPVAFLRDKEDSGWAMIIAAGRRGLQVPHDCRGIDGIAWDELGDYEYSTDRKTWHRCEVAE